MKFQYVFVVIACGCENIVYSRNLPELSSGVSNVGSPLPQQNQVISPRASIERRAGGEKEDNRYSLYNGDPVLLPGDIDTRMFNLVSTWDEYSLSDLSDTAPVESWGSMELKGRDLRKRTNFVVGRDPLLYDKPLTSIPRKKTLNTGRIWTEEYQYYIGGNTNDPLIPEPSQILFNTATGFKMEPQTYRYIQINEEPVNISEDPAALEASVPYIILHSQEENAMVIRRVIRKEEKKGVKEMKWSDLLWWSWSFGFWGYPRKTPKELKYIHLEKIHHRQTVAIMKEISNDFKRLKIGKTEDSKHKKDKNVIRVSENPDTQEPYNNQEKIKRAFWALLGTPHIRECERMLAEHARTLGRKQIKHIDFAYYDNDNQGSWYALLTIEKITSTNYVDVEALAKRGEAFLNARPQIDPDTPAFTGPVSSEWYNHESDYRGHNNGKYATVFVWHKQMSIPDLWVARISVSLKENWTTFKINPKPNLGDRRPVAAAIIRAWRDILAWSDEELSPPPDLGLAFKNENPLTELQWISIRDDHAVQVFKTVFFWRGGVKDFRAEDNFHIKLSDPRDISFYAIAALPLVLEIETIFRENSHFSQKKLDHFAIRWKEGHWRLSIVHTEIQSKKRSP